MPTVDFTIYPAGEISKKFLERDISTFENAIHFMRKLAYRRNTNKNNLISVFEDNCGTCSTKHAILKVLADENNFHHIKLFIGIFKMNQYNTPAIASTLKYYGLEYIPEAHCYLRINESVIDGTKLNSKPSDFINDLLNEVEIKPNQISDYKIDYHKNYLHNWLTDSKNKFNLNEIWDIREQCIRDLVNN